MNPILIVSGSGDVHADNFCKILEAKGIRYFFLHTDKYPYDTQLTFSSEDGFLISDEHERIRITQDWSIWNRRLFPPTFPQEFPKNLEEMVVEESKRTIQGLIVSHNGLVVNNPFSNYVANNKIEQLQRAKTLGLIVPDTIITNDPDQAKSFYERHEGDIIFKMQKLPIIEEGGTHKTVMTNRVTHETFWGNLHRIRNAPCCFQERVEKEYEIRLTVIGNRLFPIAIHSQDSELSRNDFRRYDFENVRYELVELPKTIKDKVLELTRQYRLHYAAIDLIHTPDGKDVFLEVNPNGQYLWTEEMSGVKITDALVNYLSLGNARSFD